MNTDKIVRAALFAKNIHYHQKYDGRGYDFHLLLVVSNVKDICRFTGVCDNELVENLVCAGWLHDVMEDSGTTYNDIKTEFGEFVAELVYGCTCEKGRTRKDRFSEKFYSELRKIPYAFFVKACDRLANMRYSKASGSSMYDKYKAELVAFLEKGKPIDWISEEEQILSEEVISLLLEV